MASFIQPNHSARHLGVARLESTVGMMRRGFDSTKGLSAMLLAALVSALVVVADQLIDTWADGHLMLAWVALWLVSFATLAVFSGAARQLAATVVHALDVGSRWFAQARVDWVSYGRMPGATDPH